jgi:hypothetical protein
MDRIVVNSVVYGLTESVHAPIHLKPFEISCQFSGAPRADPGFFAVRRGSRSLVLGSDNVLTEG